MQESQIPTLFGDGIMRESKILASFQRCENQAHCVLKLVLEWGHSHVRMNKRLLPTNHEKRFA